MEIGVSMTVQTVKRMLHNINCYGWQVKKKKQPCLLIGTKLQD